MEVQIAWEEENSKTGFIKLHICFQFVFNIIVELLISYVIFFYMSVELTTSTSYQFFNFLYISARLTFNFEKMNYLFSWDRFLKTYDVNNSKLWDKLRIYEIDQCGLWMIYMVNRCLKYAQDLI